MHSGNPDLISSTTCSPRTNKSDPDHRARRSLRELNVWSTKPKQFYYNSLKVMKELKLFRKNLGQYHSVKLWEPLSFFNPPPSSHLINSAGKGRYHLLAFLTPSMTTFFFFQSQICHPFHAVFSLTSVLYKSPMGKMIKLKFWNNKFTV